jgi:hypothetical protein
MLPSPSRPFQGHKMRCQLTPFAPGLEFRHLQPALDEHFWILEWLLQIWESICYHCQYVSLKTAPVQLPFERGTCSHDNAIFAGITCGLQTDEQFVVDEFPRISSCLRLPESDHRGLPVKNLNS